MKNIELESMTGTKCPSCKYEESFTNYLDSSTGLPVEEGIVGKCNNERCNYHLPPKLNNIKYLRTLLQNTGWSYSQSQKDEYAIYGYPCSDYWKNEPYDSNLVSFLISKFGKTSAKRTVSRYKVSSPGYDKCLNVFWYIDSKKNILKGKVYKFDESLAKITPVFDDVQIRINNIPDYYPHYYAKDKVFFGLHLTSRKTDSLICIVENEFTAIVASIVMPEYTWLATGGQELNYELVKPILNRDVMLFPNKNKFQEWKSSAKLFEFKLSLLLENNNSKISEDIADYFLNQIESRKKQ